MQWFWAWNLQIQITERKKKTVEQKSKQQIDRNWTWDFLSVVDKWSRDQNTDLLLVNILVTWPEYWPLMGQYLVNQDGRVTLPCRAYGQAGVVPDDGKILTAHKNYAFGKMLNESKLDQFLMLCPANAIQWFWAFSLQIRITEIKKKTVEQKRSRFRRDLNLRLSVRYSVFLPLGCPHPLVRIAEIFLVYCNWIP